MKHYQHVQKEKRFYIWQAKRGGNTQTKIAAKLDRHPSTLSREIKRTTYAQGHVSLSLGPADGEISETPRQSTQISKAQ